MGRLIDALDAGDTCFIVHIDKRVKDIEPFRKVVDSRSKAWLTGERYFVQWGSWSQVRYQRLFLKEALNADADRIFIISGQDYPLWDNDRIRRYCEDNADKAFVCGLDITALPPPLCPMRKYLELWHLCRDLPINHKGLYHAVTVGLRTLLRLLPLRRKPYLSIDGETWHVWQASGYLSVNRRQAQYIISRLNDRRISSYFRHCFVPEEITIPTIIFNSPWRNEARVYEHNAYHGIASLAALHYFVYGAQIKVFTAEDYDTLIASDRMFCRKVISGASDELVRLIDEHRRQTEQR